MKRRVDPVELKGQLRIPVEIADLALLQTHPPLRAVRLGELRDAHIDVELTRDRLAGRDCNLLEHQAASLGTHGDGGGFLPTQRNRDAIVAGRDRD